MSAVPLRVLHLHSGNLYGGVETLLATIARRQGDVPATRHAFALCFPGRCADELGAAGAALAPLGAVRVRQPWTVLAARRRLATLLRAERPDVVVTHSPWAHALFAPTVRGAALPLAFWRHGATDGRHWLDRWARRTPPDLVICNSRFVAASAGLAFPGTRAEVMYYPVEPSAEVAAGTGGRPATPGPRDGATRRNLRASLGAADGRTIIVQVSRMEPWKGHAVLIEALGELRPNANWLCWIVGGAQRPEEAAYQRRLQERAAALGLADRVHFLGQRADVPALLAAADIFCQPNIGPEPFGIVFVEALSHGLPVVATAIGAAPEIVAAPCGVLVPAGDAHALAVALGGLLEDRARRTALGSAGPARAAALCDPVRQLRRLGHLLGTVAGRELPAPEEPTR